MPNGGALNKQSAVPIFSGHDVCLVDNVYRISRSTWHSPSVTVRCSLAPHSCKTRRARVPDTDCSDRIVLRQGLVLAGHAQIQSKTLYSKGLSQREAGSSGEVSRTQRKTAVRCTCNPDTRVQPTSGIPWRLIKRHGCASRLSRPLHPGDFRFWTARLLQHRKHLDALRQIQILYRYNLDNSRYNLNII